jgi:hypothetical protein
MVELKTIDFLHYGDGLNSLSNILDLQKGVFNKDELILMLNKENNTSDFAHDIIKGYKGDDSKVIDIEEFKKDLNKSEGLNWFFKSLNCRGFSYRVINNFELSCYLKPSVNFRLALLSSIELYYPIRLRKYLTNSKTKKYKNHLFNEGYPTIAFALGQIIDKKLYIFVLQTDIAQREPAYVREYLKGWRRILFAEIISYAKINNIQSVFLCSLESKHWTGQNPVATGTRWFNGWR